MGDIVQGMIRDAILAFVGEDAMLAQKTMGADDAVDALNDQIMRETLHTEAAKDPSRDKPNIATALTRILIARSLERFGDQATNICEEVIYMVQGADVRHSQKPRPQNKAKAG
jgi:phosphate transport system protein